MCGITGIYAFNEIGRLFSIHLARGNKELQHRGPDADNVFTDYYVGLGHRRLSIIDLSTEANQPMSDPSERFTIVFNGEIYNYRELRQQLEAKGVTFQTQSDTEVLLQLYIHEGEKCLNKLHGFFAFAVFDKSDDSLFVARDRFGIKPLVYYKDEDKLIFASEIKSLFAYNIPQETDWTSVLQYFQLSYIPAPNTIFKNIFKLEPGHYMTVRNKEVQIQKYYQLQGPDEPTKAPCSYEEAQKRLLELLDESVQERMIADVPLGAFLSGGIDSSTVVALASKYTSQLNTFSIGYKNEPLFDETKYAEMVANKYKTNHTAFQLTTQDFYEHLFKLLDFYGEPFADSSAIPVYMLCELTKKHVTVALSGDGGDEIFAGYNKYQGEFKAREKGTAARMLGAALPVLEILPKSRNSYLGNKVRQLHRFAEGMGMSDQERYWYLSSWRSEMEAYSMFTGKTRSLIIDSEYEARKEYFTQHITGNGINDMLFADMKMLLPNDMLHKVDSMSMAHALEVRVPFLDHRIAEFAFSLPASYKINGNMKKRLLQDAVRPLLPDEIYNRPKHGFEVPLAKGFKNELKPWVEEMLDLDFVREQEIFSPDYIEQVRKQVFHTNNFDQNQVWAILAFQHWWKKFSS
ncbi:asparagine synthase (glutamine-hydrolyzing) [Limibacter armeniacum]|uniref:asparagine synthase (glutamine-hydrolyzing) n=1 Tax=Limibacter armeniacum TaxID=466084 RepID=UPI002FE58FD8